MTDTPVRRSASHLVAASLAAGGRPLVVKEGDTFVVFDQAGEICPGGLGEEGLFHEGTRFLSHFALELEQHPLLYLDSFVGSADTTMMITLTNPALVNERTGAHLGLATLHVSISKFLWRGVLYQRAVLTNYGVDDVSVRLFWTFGADYVDIFEVRVPARLTRGRYLPAEVSGDRVTLGYQGRDDIRRYTHLTFSPPPTHLTASSAQHDVHLARQGWQTIDVAVACGRSAKVPRPHAFLDAQSAAIAAVQTRQASWGRITTSDPFLTSWMAQAIADVQMLTTDTRFGPYPYAGLPWFNTPFGRDGIITALECLWIRPELARGVLNYLAHTQATAGDPERDAEPGKILHETRSGELAATGEIPFGQYYGSVDSTPLFVALAGAYYERTGDLSFVESIWPSIEAALEWIDRFGDKDGDGFVEYARERSTGLVNQGWKDADDAIVHRDGTVATGPIAMSEVQGYVYAAWCAAGTLAQALGLDARVSAFADEVESLRTAFDRSFWCDELGTFALALDGDKQPCRVRASNAGQCLFGGIVDARRMPQVAEALLDDDGFSGWGVRTLAARQAHYNPMGYHIGAVWPHDNALIAQGLARYGYAGEAMRIQQAMFEASLHFDTQRMPELFCGFARLAAEPPVPYPLACAPQAWAAGAVLLLMQAVLGLHVDGCHRRIVFTRPQLPLAAEELVIHGLVVRDARVDLRIFRRHGNVGVKVLRSEGKVDVVVT